MKYFRTENILHCLGTVTSFCCTDKKGVLSWPNTSPEKLFFLRSDQEEKGVFDDTFAEEEADDEVDDHCLTPEILTLSQDHNNPDKVQIDDTHWRDHLSSLKPLALSMLLNTCNTDTEDRFTEFYHFLVSESQDNTSLSVSPDLLPIPSRNCLCPLRQKIGVNRRDLDKFVTLQQFQSYRPASPQPSSVFRQMSLARMKMLVGHQVSVLTREQDTGRMSLISQGTGDVVLESCSDAWTGHDVVTMNSATRKKISEFYQRASLTSYCTAFAYKPVLSCNTSQDQSFIQLPASSVRKMNDEDCISVGSLDETSQQRQDNILSTLQSQTFLGMVQSQYQALVDMVQFVDLLEKACIRFVHFSQENELRSRVFSEKMGLESGWNCHISLHSAEEVETAASKLFHTHKSRPGMNDQHWTSASLPDTLNHSWRLGDLWSEKTQPLLEKNSSVHCSGSSLSSMLEYDMNNRAQLPTGIDNIRPHLETMDNVPLLVSLFTDCTPDTTAQMMQILLENDEVIAVLGSAANHHNMRIFQTAAASLAVEPLYPRVCRASESMTPVSSGQLTPSELSRYMVSLGSSVSFRREEEVSTVYRAIIRSRRNILAIRRCLQWWTSSCLLLSLTVVTCILLLLPSPLTPGQVLLLTTLTIPALTTATFFSAYDNNISSMSTGKNRNIFFNKDTVWHSVWCYGLRFIIPLLAVSLSHLLSILSLKHHQISDEDPDEDDDICPDPDQLCYDGVKESLSIISDLNMTFITIYLTLTAVSFVSRTDHIWRYKPKRSWHIFAVSFLILSMQVIYFIVVSHNSGIHSVPFWSWLIHSVCCPLQIISNELVKRHEIKVNVRFQKRARLDFNTKLGINSPF